MEETPQPQKPIKGGEKNLMAILCYLGILVVIPLLTAKDDPFVKFHIKQGLVLLIASVINIFISMVPFIGWVVGFVIWIIILVLAIMGILNVLGGKQKPLPVIGQFAKKFNF